MHRGSYNSVVDSTFLSLYTDNLGILFYHSVGCPPGFFLDTSDKQCHECDIGSYQDREGQISCQSCLSGYTTVRKKSKSVGDCYRVKADGNEGNSTRPSVFFLREYSQLSKIDLDGYHRDRGVQLIESFDTVK